MRFTTPIVAVIGFTTSIMAFTTPSDEMLSIAARQAVTDPCSLADSKAVNASIQLASWVECRINGFFPFPENGAWDSVFGDTFSKDVLASFNDTRYNFDGWLQTYRSINETLGKNFAPFKHGFINTLAVPNANGDKGGFVYAIGWEGGFHKAYQRDLYFTDATFVVVKDYGGKRKIVEFRESSNIPNTAVLPRPNNWKCGIRA